ncbi:hypothetical protein DE146DRAFT_616609 [Phaeosphaeria sp. MPI-PUGE-AT-0046c]|nr:hypothetical protein DE146DRAFT_616609 [Phaeosphaeria sp. MPI-PUGE-AT-0046c]
MNSKKMFSWSKRQSSLDNYYRTGGIVPIDTGPVASNHGAEQKSTPKSGRKPPSGLTIITTDNKQYLASPFSATYMFNAASTLQTAVNDILRSPAPCTSAFSRPVSELKPLPSRPRSLSVPSTPELPAELPGSILLDNQGFPTAAVETSLLRRGLSQTSRRNTLPLVEPIEDTEDISKLLSLFPEPLHSKSVPDLGHIHTAMRTDHNGNGLHPALASQITPSRIQHKRSLSESTVRTYPQSHILDASLSNTGKPTAIPTSTIRNKTTSTERQIITTPTPSATRSKQIEELKSTIATQDQTISTLQVQFASLRASHDSHIASLSSTHSAEVASLKNYARVLEDQLAQRPSLHHGINNLLFVIDTTEPLTLTHENSQQRAGSCSTEADQTTESAVHAQQCSPQRTLQDSDMENLKRKLSSTRRPETASRSLLPELNQFKQNNVALQKQIESLMAKLNESKQSERALKASVHELTHERDGWQQRAEDANTEVKNAQALQNTIDHLEDRLEIANIEKLDAAEQLLNFQLQRSPFEIKAPRCETVPEVEGDNTKDAHLSLSTVFSSSSPVSAENESRELSTLATFVSHIERLQDQVRQQEKQVAELESEKAELQRRYDQLQRDHETTNLQMEIQNELIKKTRRTDAHIEQLRTAVLDREAIIREKAKSCRAVERQLELHKLLLQAQIRRNATLTIYNALENDPLPDLGSLTARADVDAWIERLQQRLKKDKRTNQIRISNDPKEALITDLRQEIDFYVREIIYYKLDIRGYKSDLKKLNRITSQLAGYGSRASDLDSETSSIKRVVTPNLASSVGTPELGSAVEPTHGALGAIAQAISDNRPITPPTASNTSSTRTMRTPSKTSDVRRLDMQLPMTPQSPTSEAELANTTAFNSTHTTSRSHSNFSPKRRKPTPHSGDQVTFGSLLTEFPLNTPTRPPQHARSMSESIAASRFRNRSASISEPATSRGTPERPPRPRYGLFESPRSKRNAAFEAATLPQAEVLSKFSKRRSVCEDNLQTSSISGNNLLASEAEAIDLTTTNTPISQAVAPERKGSAASSSSIPFVIAMGSPHNPALVIPVTSIPPTSCSIARNQPLRIIPVTSRMGVGGTMASTTPVTSPISPRDVTGLDFPLRSTSTKPLQMEPTAPKRKFSISKKHEEQSARPETPSHSRSGSASSIRTAIRLPRSRDKEKEAHKMRKDSISMPRPLGSPFGFKRSMSAGMERRDESDREAVEASAYGVGEAL